MGRKRSKLFTIYYRNNSVWIWWPDGKGAKFRKAVTNEHGETIHKQVAQAEQEKRAYETYNGWCDHAARAAEERKQQVDKTPLGAVTGFYVESQGLDWDPLTIEKYLLRLEILQNYFGVQTPIGAITPEAALEFISDLRHERIKAPATDRDYIGFYKLVFKIAVDAGFISLNPFATIKCRKMSKPHKDAFSPLEVHLIIRAAWETAPWFAPVIEIASVTGAHAEELTNLRICNAYLDGTEPYLDIPDEIAKGKNGRTFGLSVQFVKMLRRLSEGRQPDEYLFLNAAGNRLPKYCFRKGPKRPWGKILANAEVRVRRFNCLRQSVDTNLTSRAGLHSTEASKYTGHTDDVSRRSYQDRPLDVTRRHMNTMCEMYQIADRANVIDGDKQPAKTEDIYPRKEIVDLVG